MAETRFRFDDFAVDTADRSLRRGGAVLDLSSRYFDALALLLAERGRLVTKDRFMAEVWRGVPVTDEALTQCIRSLRRLLGDDAARPRFIETVPKHGYRFVGAVQVGSAGIAPRPAPDATGSVLLPVAAATIGGGAAGILGGTLYGLGVNLQGLQPGLGATSALFVLLAINMLVGLVAGAGVGLGIALATRRWPVGWQSSVLGGMAGGFVTGGAAKLVGLDAFRLLLGEAPGRMTGAPEGAVLGAAVGLAAWIAGRRSRSPAQAVAIGAAATGVAGFILPLLGGTLLGGSLDQLVRRFPDSRFSLAPIGRLFGETGFGPVSQAATAGIEGLLFGACIVGALGFFLSGRAAERPPSP